jgi:tellurite resistance protein TehA-like permease
MPGHLRTLNPAWFAAVMATGIVAIAAHIGGIPAVLFWINIALYVVLWCAYLARLALFPRAHLDDLRNHARAMGYFTIPAGTAVLGVDVLVIGGSVDVARVLWFATVVLWLVLVYAVPAILVARRDKPPLETGLTGTWLVWVVATQGLAILGTRVAGTFGSGSDVVILVTSSAWLVGGMFYVWIIALIVRRLFFSPLQPGELSPTYWIDMGAMSISALAGATLLQAAGTDDLVQRTEPFVAGLTLLFWATATWWIPWLLVMGVWRHVIEHHALTFDAGFWGIVFPLGMYAVTTHTVADALAVPVLDSVTPALVWVAAAAWAGTVLDLLLTPVVRARRRAQDAA